MTAGERVFIVLAGLTAIAWFSIQYRAQALPGPRGARKSPCRFPHTTRRGLWVWPDPSSTAEGPATYRKQAQ